MLFERGCILYTYVSCHLEYCTAIQPGFQSCSLIAHFNHSRDYNT